MEEFEQSAFLLHSRPYRENQILLEFLTSQQGKISAISYLGKSLKSNKKALLQPFSPLKIVLKGQGNLKYLKRVEPESKSFKLSGNYLYSGFYLNELQVRLLGEHIPYDELYYQYQQSIEQLSEQFKIKELRTIYRQVRDMSNKYDTDKKYKSKLDRIYETLDRNSER